MKKFFTLLLICFSLLASQAQNVRISQVYGAGGTSGASYKNDYIELFNPSGSAVSLTGWSVQYASSAGVSWAVTPLSGSIGAGKYYLIALAGGTNGANLPTADATGTTNMASNTGKIALVNNSTALTVGCPSGASIIDFVGYGSSANCYEGMVGPTPAPGATTAIIRGGEGCLDNNNNALDFITAPTNPRNSASAANTCTSPYIVSGLPVSGLLGSVGVASPSASYTLQADKLSPAAGNITITPGTDVQVSLNNSTWSSVAITVPYTGGKLNATTVYVRIAATAPKGVFNSIVSHSGGGAAVNSLSISGTVYANFYNTKANNGLNDVTTWSSTLDGAGASPVDFTSDYQLFNIVDQNNAFYTGVWDVTSSNNTSRVIVGDGTSFMIFDVLSDADSLTSRTRIDVKNNAYLVLENNRLPTINNIEAGSTIDFSQAGTGTSDTIRIPALNYYNLNLTSGLKYFSSGTTTVRKDLAVIAAQINGWNRGSTSTVTVLGDFIMAAGSIFDDNNSDPLNLPDNARFTLSMEGTSGFQSIVTDNYTPIKLFRLQRGPSTPTVPTIIDASGSPLAFYLGTSTGGGLTLNESGANTTELDLGINALNIVGAGTITGSGKLYPIYGDIGIYKNAGNTHAGSLLFLGGALVGNMTIDFGPSFTRDSVFLATDVTVVGTLNMNKGKLVVNASKVLYMEDGSVATGGSSSSFVDGEMAKMGGGDFSFPVGKGSTYAPVDIANLTAYDIYNVRYVNTGYGSYNIDPTTLGTYPGYTVSRKEYWIVDQSGGFGSSLDLTLHYTSTASNIASPSAARIAHFDGIDWNDMGNDAFTGNAGSGSIRVNNVSTFSPFTFATPTNVILPIRLISFTGHAQADAALLQWRAANTESGSYFMLERSKDAQQFEEVTTVNTNGIFTDQSFSYLDTRAAKGKNYYRLKMVNPRGDIEYSHIVLVNFNTKGVISILQNPVRDVLTINLSNISGAGTLRIIDMQGKVLASRSFAAGAYTQNLDVSGLAVGTYLLQLNSGDEQITERFVKMN
jgi:hypothetical protein